MPLRSRFRALCLAGALVTGGMQAACGGGMGTAPSGERVVVNNTVVVTFTEAQDKLPFDPRAARLQEATSR